MKRILSNLKYQKMLIMAVFAIVMCLPSHLIAQNQPGERVISGVVTDENGLKIPGVSVMLKGTAIGTPTNVNGEFKLKVPGSAAVLTFSFLGYLTKEETVGDRRSIDVQLGKNAGSQNLNEVVVVGYGTQKKTTLTGAVATVKGADLVKSPEPNLSNSFAGRIPGLVALNSSGEPGYDGSTLLIRGQSTTGNNNPLVVIDGVANRLGGLERLNPSDVESVSILKDASAAIYGAQAANGVILITTKKGKSGVPTVTYNYNQGIMQPTNLPKMADAPTYATILNEIAYYRTPTGGLFQQYSADQIAKFANGSDPINYPNTNGKRRC